MAGSFVSFTEVKRAVTMEAVLTHYELFAALVPKGKNLVGACPFCEGKSSRQFQVNPLKNAWYCFGCKAGGNVLDFVAKSERLSVRAAALKLDSWFKLGLKGEAAREAPPVSSEMESEAKAPPPAADEVSPTENPPLNFTLKTLDPAHEELAALGLGAETIESFGAGYCSKGLLKGRLAIPIQGSEGELLAYAGLAIQEDETPRYLFPPKFHPELEVFNLYRFADFAREDGPLYFAPEILGVLQLVDVGQVAVLGLFDGSLSERQEDRVAGVLSHFEELVLVGEGFSDRAVSRLVRYATVSWVPEFLCTGKPR
jgi:DNA primase